ncbi:UspA domain-containing protein [Desulfovibrio sp. X2]|uniref:universal stress protein n=1 Tax=Desulfovibrio sp. X2 TaxID=941449 RepID=UPI000358C2BA|nr:universal stress protein [Desulfovibrio sp. X2]EPR43689.1 UspA domain-containing protein [Desulfovibrio sp. X2]
MISIEKPRTILCPIDFSPPMAKIAGYARMLAECSGAEVVALYVAPAMNRYAKLYVAPDMIGSLEQEIRAGAKEQLHKALEEHFKGVSATGRVVIGYPPEAILDEAEKSGADLIVMGTHGRKGADRILFGSVAEKVVKTSPVPVLTVRP